MKTINGTGVAMVTPFNKEGEIDTLALQNLTEYLINGGVDFLVVMGTTAESAVLTTTERSKAIALICNTNAGRKPIVLGIGGNNTQAVVRQIKNTNFDKIDAILSVTPYYNKPTQDGLFAHFEQIALHCHVPIILYNVPGRTSVNMTANTTLKLANTFKNIIAVKEASGNFTQIMQIINEKPVGFNVFSGDDALVMPLISAGADGVISVTANAYPKLFSEMINAGKSDRTAVAREIHYKLLDFTNSIFKEGNPAGIKTALHELNICENIVRLPLLSASKNLTSEIAKLVLALS